MRNSKRGEIPDDLGKLIADLDNLFERVQKLEAPSGESAASTLALTLGQITELQTRTILSNEATYDRTVVLGTDAIPFNTPALAPVEFTLAARRKIYLRMSCYVALIAINDGTVVVDPFAAASLKINLENIDTGAITTVSSPVSIGAGYLMTMRTLGRSTQRAFLDDYQTLLPGSYRATFAGTVTNLAGTTGSVQFFNPRMAVQILEKV